MHLVWRTGNEVFTTRNYMIHLLGDYGGQVQLLLSLLHEALSHDGGHEEGSRGQEMVRTEGLYHQHVVEGPANMGWGGGRGRGGRGGEGEGGGEGRGREGGGGGGEGRGGEGRGGEGRGGEGRAGQGRGGEGRGGEGRGGDGMGGGGVKR